MMSHLDPDEETASEASYQLAQDEPIPGELRDRLATVIEPHTMNMELDHGDVMTCINVAYPVIREWLRSHIAEL